MRHEIDGFSVLPDDAPRLNAALDRLMGDAALSICRSGSGGSGMVFNGTNCRIVGRTLRGCPNMSASVQNRGTKIRFPSDRCIATIAVCDERAWPRPRGDSLVRDCNQIGRSPFSAGLHADGLSLWQRQIICNEMRWLSLQLLAFSSPFAQNAARTFYGNCSTTPRRHDVPNWHASVLAGRMEGRS
jgi:hypothetical protein